ncbi:MAG: T9SS type A sorting domain-containing protein, partial [Bacteroidota bacterium]
CSSTVTQAVIVLPSPSLSPIPSSTLLCIGETCTITAAGANNYTWMPGGSNASSIIVSPSIASVYSLTQSIGNCVDIKTVSLIVNGLPTITAMASPSIVCSLGNTTLSGTGALAYTWQPYGGTGATVVVSPTVNTIFTLSASDGTCANSTTVSLFAQPIPTLNIAASPSIVCPGDPATLTVSGAPLYSWMPTSSNSSVVVVNPVTSTSYSVTGTNSLGCSSIASQFILVKSVPAFSISTTNSFICKGSTTTLSALGANSYSWIGGPANPIWVVNPNSTTTFSVKGHYSNIGCASTQTISVVVFEPQFTITGNPVVCSGGSTTLTASGANSYTWNGNFFFPFMPVSPTVYTVYQVSASSSSNNLVCSSTKTIGVAVNPNPIVTASASKSLVCIGESIIISASGAATYTWSNFQPGASVTVTPAGQQSYTVTGTDTNGCSNTAIVFVNTSECTSIKETEFNHVELIIYPNPNQGEFKIAYASDINLTLVNALGQLIRYINLRDLNNHEEHISLLAPGVYFIVGSGNKHCFNQKILVVK